MKHLAPDSRLPNSADLSRALQSVAAEIFPFAVVLFRDVLRAESAVLEVLLVSLENSWISFAITPDREISHADFREDIFKGIWSRAHKDLSSGKNTPDLPYSESSMRYYQLELEERAAIHLRMKGKFSYEAISGF